MGEIRYIESLLALGIALLLASLLFKKLEKSSFSLPMLLVLFGMGIGWLTPFIPEIHPLEQKIPAEHLTEMAVIISLVGAGLKIDRDLGWKSWKITWRLLAVAMPLCILSLMLGGWLFMGISLAASILLGGAMAPTDPVLASGVQVGAPGEGKEHTVRFGLTSEAGFNDGLAFPFIHLAILLAAGTWSETWWEWLSFYVIWKICFAVVIGYITGRVLAYLFFKVVKQGLISNSLIVLSLTLISYGVAEVCQCYGFIAVFISAYFFRRYEKNHSYHEELHNFSEQAEQILLSILLLLFGLLLTQNMLYRTDIPMILLALAFLFIIRPAAGYLSLLGMKIPAREKLAISFLGIRGIGSFYYIAYAFSHSDSFSQIEMEVIWTFVSLVVLLSIIIHGILTPIIMRRV